MNDQKLNEPVEGNQVLVKGQETESSDPLKAGKAISGQGSYQNSKNSYELSVKSPQENAPHEEYYDQENQPYGEENQQEEQDPALLDAISKLHDKNRIEHGLFNESEKDSESDKKAVSQKQSNQSSEKQNSPPNEVQKLEQEQPKTEQYQEEIDND